MEVLETLLNDIEIYLPKLKLILVLMQLGINTEEKPDVICNKCKLMRWIQKDYEDIIWEMRKEI